MLQREVSNGLSAQVCPTCGERLSKEGDLLICAQHGAYFSYGPHLLVRAPEKEVKMEKSPMPWDVAEPEQVF